MTERVDATIVGAGPAGLAAGIVLARSGLRVLVCDRQRLPIDKACGEGLLPTGVGYLKQLDAARYLPREAVYPFTGIRYHAPGGQSATAEFAEGPGWGIRRLDLSAALVHAAQGWPHLEIVEGVPVHDLRAVADGTLVRLGDRQVLARLLVGADGLNSCVRRWAGLEGGPQRLRRLGARQHFRIEPWSDRVEVFAGRGIEAYVTPCGRRMTGVAFLWDQALYPHARGGTELIASLLAAFPGLRQRLDGAPAASAPRGLGPLHRVATGRCADGVILIGDAGGYLDACTGEGLSLALAQALSLEQTVAPVLRRGAGKPLARELAAYDWACRSITRPCYLGTRLHLFVTRRPALADRFVRTMSACPGVMQRLLSANMGRASFWPGWRASLRLTGALLCSR